jgi:hypothetical protein
VQPPSPRGGILARFENRDPDGHPLSTRYYFSPDADGKGPYLIVELDVGTAVATDFVDAVFDRIAPNH